MVEPSVSLSANAITLAINRLSVYDTRTKNNSYVCGSQSTHLRSRSAAKDDIYGLFVYKGRSRIDDF